MGNKYTFRRLRELKSFPHKPEGLSLIPRTDMKNHKLTILVYAARQKQGCLTRVEGELTPQNCPVIPTWMLWHVYSHTYTHQTHTTNNKINQLKSRVSASIESHLFEVVFLFL